MPSDVPEENSVQGGIRPKPQEQPRAQTAKDKLVLWVAARFPWLPKTMREGAMTETVEHFTEGAMIQALALTIVLIVISAWFVIVNAQNINKLLLIPLLFIYYILALFLFIQGPRAKMSKRRRDIDHDVLFAGRHLWIALKGGLPLFDSLVAISKSNYGEVSKEINRVVEKVFIGTPLDTAMQEVIEDNPSPSFNRMVLSDRQLCKIGSRCR